MMISETCPVSSESVWDELYFYVPLHSKLYKVILNILKPLTGPIVQSCSPSIKQLLHKWKHYS